MRKKWAVAKISNMVVNEHFDDSFKTFLESMGIKPTLTIYQRKDIMHIRLTVCETNVSTCSKLIFTSVHYTTAGQ